MVARLLRGRVCLGGFGAKFVLIVFLAMVSSVFGQVGCGNGCVVGACQPVFPANTQTLMGGVNRPTTLRTCDFMPFPTATGGVVRLYDFPMFDAAFLNQHTFYARSHMEIRRAGGFADFVTPPSGKVGAANTVRLNGTSGTFRSMNMDGQRNPGGAYLQSILEGVGATGNTITVVGQQQSVDGIGLLFPSSLSWGRRDAQPTLSAGDGGTVLRASGIEPEPVVGTALAGSVYGFNLPKFPDLRNFDFASGGNSLGTVGGSGSGVISSNRAQANPLLPGRYASITVVSGEVLHMSAGTYFIDGNIDLGNGSAIRLLPNDGSFRTVIYVGGNVTFTGLTGQGNTRNGALFAPIGGVFLSGPNFADSLSLGTSHGLGNPPSTDPWFFYNPDNSTRDQNITDALGQVLIVMVGSSSNQRPRFEMANGSVFVGSVLNPFGYVLLGGNTNPSNATSFTPAFLFGRIWADMIDIFNYDFRTAARITPPNIIEGNLTFLTGTDARFVMTDRVITESGFSPERPGTGRSRSVPIQLSIDNIEEGFTLDITYTIVPGTPDNELTARIVEGTSNTAHAWVATGHMSRTVNFTHQNDDGRQTLNLFDLNIVDNDIYDGDKTFRVNVVATPRWTSDANDEPFWFPIFDGNDIFTITDDDPPYIIVRYSDTEVGSATEVNRNFDAQNPATTGGSRGGVWGNPLMQFRVVLNDGIYTTVPPSWATFPIATIEATPNISGVIFAASDITSAGVFSVDRAGSSIANLDYETVNHRNLTLTATVAGATFMGDGIPFRLMPHNDNRAEVSQLLPTVGDLQAGLIYVLEGVNDTTIYITVDGTDGGVVASDYFTYNDIDMPANLNRLLVRGFARGAAAPTNTYPGTVPADVATLTTPGMATISVSPNRRGFIYNHAPAILTGSNTEPDDFFVLVRDTADYAGYAGILPTDHQSGHFDFWIEVEVNITAQDNHPLEPNGGWASGLPALTYSLFENDEITIDMSRHFKDLDGNNGFGGWEVLSATAASAGGRVLAEPRINQPKTFMYNSLPNVEIFEDVVTYVLRGTRGRLTDLPVFVPNATTLGHFASPTSDDSLYVRGTIDIRIRPINDIQLDARNATFNIAEGQILTGNFVEIALRALIVGENGSGSDIIPVALVENNAVPNFGTIRPDFGTTRPERENDFGGTNAFLAPNPRIDLNPGNASILFAGQQVVPNQVVPDNEFRFTAIVPGVYTLTYTIQDDFFPNFDLWLPTWRNLLWDAGAATEPEVIPGWWTNGTDRRRYARPAELSDNDWNDLNARINRRFTTELRTGTITINVMAGNTNAPQVVEADNYNIVRLSTPVLENETLPITLNVRDADFAKNLGGSLGLLVGMALTPPEQLTITFVGRGNRGTATLTSATNGSVAPNANGGTATLTNDGTITFNYVHGGDVRTEGPFVDTITINVRDNAQPTYHSINVRVIVNILPINDNAPTATGGTMTLDIGREIGFQPTVARAGDGLAITADYDIDEWSNNASAPLSRRASVRLARETAQVWYAHPQGHVELRTGTGLGTPTGVYVAIQQFPDNRLSGEFGNITVIAPHGIMPIQNAWFEYVITDTITWEELTAAVNDAISSTTPTNESRLSPVGHSGTATGRIYVNLNVNAADLINGTRDGTVALDIKDAATATALTSASPRGGTPASGVALNNLLSGVGTTENSRIAANRVVFTAIPTATVAQLWAVPANAQGESVGTLRQVVQNDITNAVRFTGTFEYRHLGIARTNAGAAFSYRGVLPTEIRNVANQEVLGAAIEVDVAVYAQNNSRPRIDGRASTLAIGDERSGFGVGNQGTVVNILADVTQGMTDDDDNWGGRVPADRLTSEFRVAGLLIREGATDKLVDSVIVRRNGDLVQWTGSNFNAATDSITVRRAIGSDGGGWEKNIVLSHHAEVGNGSGNVKRIDFATANGLGIGVIVTDLTGKTLFDGTPEANTLVNVSNFSYNEATRTWSGAYPADNGVGGRLNVHRANPVVVPVAIEVRNVNNFRPELNFNVNTTNGLTTTDYRGQTNIDTIVVRSRSTERRHLGQNFNVAGQDYTYLVYYGPNTEPRNFVTGYVFVDRDLDGDNIVYRNISNIQKADGDYMGNMAGVFSFDANNFVVNAASIDASWTGTVDYEAYDGVHVVQGRVFVKIVNDEGFSPTTVSGEMTVNEGGRVSAFNEIASRDGFITEETNRLLYLVKTTTAIGWNYNADRVIFTQRPERGHLWATPVGGTLRQVVQNDIINGTLFDGSAEFRYYHINGDNVGYTSQEIAAMFSDRFRFIPVLPVENGSFEGTETEVSIVINPRNNNAPIIDDKSVSNLGVLREGVSAIEFAVLRNNDGAPSGSILDVAGNRGNTDFDFGTWFEIQNTTNNVRVVGIRQGIDIATSTVIADWQTRFAHPISGAEATITATRASDTTISVGFTGELRQATDIWAHIRFDVIDPTPYCDRNQLTNDGENGAENRIHPVVANFYLRITPQNDHAPTKPMYDDGGTMRMRSDSVFLAFNGLGGENAVIVPVMTQNLTASVDGVVGVPMGTPRSVVRTYLPTDADGDRLSLVAGSIPGIGEVGGISSVYGGKITAEIVGQNILVNADEIAQFTFGPSDRIIIDGRTLLAKRETIIYQITDRAPDGITQATYGASRTVTCTLHIFVVANPRPDISALPNNGVGTWRLNEGARGDIFSFVDANSADTRHISASEFNETDPSVATADDTLSSITDLFEFVDRLVIWETAANSGTLVQNGELWGRLSTMASDADIVELGSLGEHFTETQLGGSGIRGVVVAGGAVGALEYRHDGGEVHRDGFSFNVMLPEEFGSLMSTSDDGRILRNGTMNIVLNPRNNNRPLGGNLLSSSIIIEQRLGGTASVRTLHPDEIAGDDDQPSDENFVKIPSPAMAATLPRPGEFGLATTNALFFSSMAQTPEHAGRITLAPYYPNGDTIGVVYTYTGALWLPDLEATSGNFEDIVFIQVMDSTSYSVPFDLTNVADRTDDRLTLNGTGNKNYIGFLWDTLRITIVPENNRGAFIDGSRDNVEDGTVVDEATHTVSATLMPIYVPENGEVRADEGITTNHGGTWFGGVVSAIPLKNRDVALDSARQVILADGAIWTTGTALSDVSHFLDENGDELFFVVSQEGEFGEVELLGQNGTFMYTHNPERVRGIDASFVDTVKIEIRDRLDRTGFNTVVTIPVRIVPRKDEATTFGTDAQRTISVVENNEAAPIYFIRDLVRTNDRWPLREDMTACENIPATTQGYDRAQELIDWYMAVGDMRDFDEVEIALVAFGATRPTITADSVAWFNALANRTLLEGLDANGEINRRVAIDNDSNIVYESIRVQDSRNPITEDTVWVAIKSTNWIDCNNSRITLAPIFVDITGVAPRAQNHEMLVNEGEEQTWLHLFNTEGDPSSGLAARYRSVKGQSSNADFPYGINLYVLQGAEWGDVDVKICREPRTVGTEQNVVFPRYGTVELRSNTHVPVDENVNPWSVDGWIRYSHDETTDWRNYIQVEDEKGEMFRVPNFKDTVFYVLRDRRNPTLTDTAMVIVHIDPAPDRFDNDELPFYSDEIRIMPDGTEVSGADGIIDMVTITFANRVILGDLGFELGLGDSWAPITIDTANITILAGSNGRVVRIPLLDMPQNITSGTMSLRLTYLNFPLPAIDPDDPEEPVRFRTAVRAVADGAAPVVTDARFFKNATAGVMDILEVDLSEGAWAAFENGDHPFMVFKTDASTAIGSDVIENVRVRLIDTTNVGGRTRVRMEVLSGEIAAGDSLFINPATRLRDMSPRANFQTAYNNIRRDIRVEYVNSIVGAWYLDTSSVRDGFVSVIRVQTATEMDDASILAQLSARIGTTFTIPSESANRNFEVIEIVPARWTEGLQTYLGSGNTHFGFDIVVNDSSLVPNTAVGARDVISLTEEIKSTIDPLLSLSSLVGEISIRDSIAPVITEASLFIRNTDTTLVVMFSEAVQTPDHGRAFDFFDSRDATGNTVFYMDTDAPVGSGRSWSYRVRRMSKAFPNNSDSIRIVVGDRIRDMNSNFQTDTTVWAQLRVPPDDQRGIPEADLWVYPSPARLVSRNGR
ncbi:MAG: hypothetical protein FWE23_08325, partial [Chitinivibrionia bacterium]|nr:hypothetical protein [Chitinivibrionia bacterium]